MANGYIKLHRDIVDWYGFSNSKRVHLWITLLVRASYKQKNFFFNGQIVDLQEGQFITGRQKLSQITGISESYVEKLLSEFESLGQIRQQKSNRNRLITIVKWNDYQVSDNGKTEERTTERHLRGQQKDTIKKEKNGKKEKNNTMGDAFVVFKDKFISNWNDVLCDHCPKIPKIFKITKKREDKLRSRFKEEEFRDNIIQMFDTICKVDFLKGEAEGTPWMVTFDWIIENDTNYIKILEGKYKNKQKERIDEK